MSKSFFNFREESGAGDTGTDSLVNKYKSETPGQGESGEKKQKARKGDMLQNKDEPKKSLTSEDVVPSADRKPVKYRDPNTGRTKIKMQPAKKHTVEETELDEKFSGNDVMNEQVENIMEGLPKEKFQSAEAKLVAYAKKNGGIDKRDFMEIAKMCGQIGRLNILQAGQVLARLNRKVDGLDTDVRDKVFEIMKSVQLMEAMDKPPFTPDPKKKPVKNSDGSVQSPMSRVKALAKSAAKKYSKEDMDAMLDQLIEEEINYLEENYEESSMMQNQVEAMEHFLDGIDEYIEECEDCPEWFQNKLTMAFSQLQSLYAYATGEMGKDDDDEEEMEEYYEATVNTADIQKNKNISQPDKDKLSKLRQMLDKEKKK